MNFDVIRCILSFLTAAFALCLGVFIFLFFASFYSSVEGSSKSRQLEEEHLNQYGIRNAELIYLLNQIGPPDLSTGHYSEDKEVLWSFYFDKLKEHEHLTKLEHKQEIDAYYGHT